jgi:hypothetical protein
MITALQLAVVLALSPVAGGDSQWVLEQSTLTYHVSHPLHESEGVSHMVQVTRGGQFPIITVRTRLPESAAGTATIHADLEVEFAGQTVTYKQVPFEQTTQDGATRIAGTIPATLAAFKIDPPSLLAIPVKNEIPVRVEMAWRKQN